jgi:hypothetical protein
LWRGLKVRGPTEKLKKTLTGASRVPFFDNFVIGKFNFHSLNDFKILLKRRRLLQLKRLKSE